MQNQHIRLEKPIYGFSCRSCFLPYNYLNLDPQCRIEDKLLCKNCYNRLTSKQNVIELNQFLSLAKSTWVSDQSSELENLKKDLRSISIFYKDKCEQFKTLFIQAVDNIQAAIEKNFVSILGNIRSLITQSTLDCIARFENPEASYDPHSLLLNIMKSFTIIYEDDNLIMKNKLGSEIREELIKFKQSYKTSFTNVNKIFQTFEVALESVKCQNIFPTLQEKNFQSKKKMEDLNTLDLSHVDEEIEKRELRVNFSTPSIKSKQEFNMKKELFATTKVTDDSLQSAYDKFTTQLKSANKRSISQVVEIQIRKMSEISVLKDSSQIISLSLNASGHQITDQNYLNLCQGLGNKYSLESLKMDISNNTGTMTRDILREILKSISGLVQLQSLHLNLRINNITPLELSAIYRLPNLTRLEFLLSFNPICDEGLLILSKELSAHHELISLKIDLQKTKIGFNGIEALFQSIMRLGNLKILHLVLSDNKINDKVIAAMKQPSSSLTNISSLDLHLTTNLIGDDGASTLGDIILNSFPKLLSIGLDIQFNEVGYNGLKNLVTKVAWKSTLEKAAINLLDNKSMALVRQEEIKSLLDSVSSFQLKYKFQFLSILFIVFSSTLISQLASI